MLGWGIFPEQSRLLACAVQIKGRWLARTDAVLDELLLTRTGRPTMPNGVAALQARMDSGMIARVFEARARGWMQRDYDVTSVVE